MNEIRNLGPTNTSSAFPFEAFFSDMQKKYRSGTLNIGKQILENMALSYLHSSHCCQKSLHLGPHMQQFTDDSLFYQYHTTTYTFNLFKVMKVFVEGRYIIAS
jgi:hypothetical protein